MIDQATSSAPAGADNELRELLGKALQHQQRNELDDAAKAYARVLDIKPDFAEVHNNLGVVLLAQGKHQQASASFTRALALRPELLDQYLNIVATLKTLNPVFGEAATRATQAWPKLLTLQELFGAPGLAAIASDPLLIHLLRSTSARSVEMERVLTSVRAALLHKANGANPDDTALRFACALAQQCFINEYVFTTSESEADLVGKLKQKNAAELTPLSLAALAMYEPLGALPNAVAIFKGDWPTPLKEVVTQQIGEPAEERQIRDSIPVLTAIEDATSQKVRDQYEANPYPRWVQSAAAHEPVLLDDHLRRQFPGAPLHAAPARATTDILVAGCGTGRNAIEIAQKYRDVNVLAVDLSLASLAHAKRKTPRALANKISYGQADILNIGAIGRSFDVVSASGVLHHLANPFAAWRGLLSVLKPGGVMHLGLYSEIARRDVVAVRKFIADRGYGSTPDEIRRCRQELLNSPHKGIARFADFFSTSECRDLLFHVQESRLTIPAIKAFLAENNLTFIGFEFEPGLMQQYRTVFAQAGQSITDLDRWHILETNYPDTFSAMYQFWVQKN